MVSLWSSMGVLGAAAAPTEPPGSWLQFHILVSLLTYGFCTLAAMAAVHETWVDELLGGLVPDDVEKMSAVLHDFNQNWETRV